MPRLHKGLRLIAALAAVAMLAAILALPAAATPPQAVTIFTDGQFVGPGTVVGTWHATGAISDSGTYVELFRLDGTGTLTIHTEKTLTSSIGTIVLDADAIVEPISPTEVTFQSGAWEMHGSGGYATLHGDGTPGAGGIADLATGVVHTFHTGFAHFDP
jgi:hypothetical protein